MRIASFVALCALLGAAPVHADDKPTTPGWTYRVQFEKDLATAHVRLTFKGFRPKRLVLMRPDALAAVRLAPRPAGRAPAGTRLMPAVRSKHGIVPRVEQDGDGVSYQVDLRALARITARSKQTQFVGRDVVTRAGLILLHPPVWPADAQVRVLLELPTGTHAAVPWPRDIIASNKAGRIVHLLPRHAMVPFARIAFGRFTPRHVKVAGGGIEYAVLDAPHRATDAGIRRWLTTASNAVSDLFAGPPVASTHVLLQPLVPGRGRPIVYGRATLSGGPQIHVMLSGTTTDAAMPGEWLTIHEWIHLGMPITTLADRWFGEGFVSYYQEVLRARAGIITPRQAWQNLHDWMERGRASGGKATLQIESARMNDRYAYHRVYWGGAALALTMDAAIRSRSAGRQSLDDVMRHFHARFVTPGTAVDALALMRHADAYLGKGPCEALARKALASRAFPDLRRTHRALGLRVVHGRVQFRQDAPDAAHRDAIMRRGGR